MFQDEDGNWHFEVDYGHFRRKFTAEELEIQKNSHIGGRQTQTAAQMICSRVEGQRLIIVVSFSVKMRRAVLFIIHGK